MRRASAVCAVLLVLTLAGCRRAPKQPPTPPPPSVSAPPLEMPPAPKPEPRVIEEPPLPPPPLPAPPEEEPTVITPSVIKLPPPPKPARKRGNGRPQAAKPKPPETKPADPKAADPKPAEAPPAQPADPAAQPPQPAPVLEEVIPGDETRRLKQSLAESQAAARNSLAALKGRRLSREQNETANRVRAFLRQAAETESRDIGSAAELARRAALLAEDLRKSIE